jgi:hypothetical protein
MNKITLPDNVNIKGRNIKGHGAQRTTRHWLRFSLLPSVLVFAFTVLTVIALVDESTGAALAQTVPGGTVPGGTIPGGTVPAPSVVYLGFKHSDEIEFEGDTQEDFVYKNEDIVAFAFATGQFSIFFDGSECGLEDANLDDFDILDDGNIIFTLRSSFDIPGLGEVDDSDVIEYTPDAAGCGDFSFRMIGADVGLTRGAEDIDGLGVAADGSLVISTIGTARVPSSTGELQVRDQALIKLDEAAGTWSLYFDGEDVALIDSSEDIRSVWIDPLTDAQGNQHTYLTLSGDFEVASNNSDEGDKNDVEGCALLQSGETTECFFFKLLDGEQTGAENQLDGLAVNFGTVSAPVTTVTAGEATGNVDAAAERLRDAIDFAAAIAEGDGGVTMDDSVEAIIQLYLPLITQ